MTALLGITRELVFSPGRVSDDSAILEMTATALRERGHAVTVIGAEESHWPEPAAGTLVFTMAQGAEALNRLREWAARGIRIVNRPGAILDCQRHRTIPILSSARVPFPESVLVETDAVTSMPGWLDGHAWVKRGDVHATEADDVVAVHDMAALRAALRRFSERGIRRAVVQRHVPGTVVKFYAVRGRFFHCVQPADAATVPPATQRRIDALGQAAAQALNVEVYGGDCVCAVNGELTLIDLNDWPSYAPCRVEAAKEIAAYLLASNTATDT
jgi:hypothetical protein